MILKDRARGKRTTSDMADISALPKREIFFGLVHDPARTALPACRLEYDQDAKTGFVASMPELLHARLANAAGYGQHRPGIRWCHFSYDRGKRGVTTPRGAHVVAVDPSGEASTPRRNGLERTYRASVDRNNPEGSHRLISTPASWLASGRAGDVHEHGVDCPSGHRGATMYGVRRVQAREEVSRDLPRRYGVVGEDYELARKSTRGFDSLRGLDGMSRLLP